MTIRHLRRLAVLVKYNPKAIGVIEKKLRLRERYGSFVVFTFWDCLKYLEIVWGEPFFRKCLSDKLSDLATVSVDQREKIERFLKDLPKLQEEIRDFMTALFKEKAKREMAEKEYEKVKKEEETRISELLKEVL